MLTGIRRSGKSELLKQIELELFNGGAKRILIRFDKYYLADTGLAYINDSGFKTELGVLIS